MFRREPLARNRHRADTSGKIRTPPSPMIVHRSEGRTMRKYSGVLALLAFAVLLPAAAVHAQSITGTVKDASGAVLPGVTVEVSSPALIEKVRSVITDGEGVYKIVDLRPGTYTVTFTLASFNTFKREGIDLPSSFTATVNAEMKVGALE